VNSPTDSSQRHSNSFLNLIRISILVFDPILFSIRFITMKFGTFSAVAALALAPSVLADETPKPVIAGLCQHSTTIYKTVDIAFTIVTQRPTTTITPTVYVTSYHGNQIVRSTDVETVGTSTRTKQTTTVIPTTVRFDDIYFPMRANINQTTSTISSVRTITASPVTTTLAPSTTTFATPSGFVMAMSALPAASSGAENVARVHARDMTLEKRRNNGLNGFLPCTHTDLQLMTATKTKTIVFGKPVTATGRPTTSTVKAKKPMTVVVTQNTIAVVTETDTISSFVTRKTTTTSISTTTSTPVRTVTPSPVAAYPACGAANLLDYTLGRANNATDTPYTQVGISSFSINHGDSVKTVSGVNSAYDCCVACQTTAECAFSAFSASKVCSIFIAQTCSSQNSDTASFYGSKSVAPGAGFTISNGKCGRWSFVAAKL